MALQSSINQLIAAIASLTGNGVVEKTGATTVTTRAIGSAANNLVALDSTGKIDPALIPATAVLPGSYKLTNITVDAQGRITSASNGGVQDILIQKTSISNDYTLVLGDGGKLIELTGSTNRTVTIPPESSVNFPIGTQLFFLQSGAGVMTISAGSGVTIQSEGNKYKTKGQYALASMIKIGTDLWALGGNLIL